MTLEQRLTEVRLTSLGHITYGALNAQAHDVLIFPVKLLDGSLGNAGIVFWGEAKVCAESIEGLIEYLKLTQDALPKYRRHAEESNSAEMTPHQINGVGAIGDGRAATNE